MKINLHHKKVFFASDFHLGAPNAEASKQREEKIIRWLNEIEDEAAAIFLVGDIFDFWFEYDTVIPKGFIRFFGKIADLRDKNIPVCFFTGNHDLWMKDYFIKELGIPVHHHPIEADINGKQFLIGHGDGLGPGDHTYKLLKKVFTNPACKWLFKWLHPDIGVKIALKWSSNSRASSVAKNDNDFKGENEWLWQYAKQLYASKPFDYFVFGHRHLPLELPVGKTGKYINLGEWVSQYTYGVFDGETFELKKHSH